MAKPVLTAAFIAESAVTRCRIVKPGTADGSVIQATAAATDAQFGIVGALDGEAGKRVDIIVCGIAEVEFGGTVTRGALVCSDANGKAVAAGPTAGNNQRIIGVAMVSAAANDIGDCLLSPSIMQG